MTMTDEEFKKLKRRFGDDVSTWPAPYRRLAENRLDENPVDSLVREAAIDKVDDNLLARKVLDGLGGHRNPRSKWLWSAFASPRLVATAALILTGAALMGGYQFARVEGRSVEASLFAVAAGAPTTFLFGDEFDRPESSL
ncbi:hypothetical protein MOV61_00175 [Neorhizobium sp. BETTINA12A]|uniref:hypothetical protein n=1 Tax=Neorhizobium sp. BETTINA12A TaxID=2908924 RepID=UPI001FF66DBF|nr:hypothetical protein [Neorhizobium sp. BETTINA12A]MCJ9749128.1 hypothetical protein [Neorhizobium sp. BETTINA12A]